MTFFKWSQTASSNSNADSTINWAEGQAPSSVNDSARAVMAAAAKYRDDISGAIVTGGTSTAYTVTSYQVFDSFAHLANNMVAFTPHATNGDTVTLNVDGLGAKPLRFSPSVEIPSNSLILGTPYVALYNTTDSAFYLQGGFSNPYSVPLSAGLDYWGTTAPNSAFVFPLGQAISRTTYSRLFAIMSTTFGVGNGSTTFNLPDKRGRVSAATDNLGGSRANVITSTYFSAVDTTTLGGVNTNADHATILTANLPASPPTTSSVTINTGSLVATISTTRTVAAGGSTVQGSVAEGSNSATTDNNITLPVSGTATGSVIMNNLGSATPMSIVQPTILCNYIIRVL